MDTRNTAMLYFELGRRIFRKGKNEPINRLPIEELRPILEKCKNLERKVNPVEVAAREGDIDTLAALLAESFKSDQKNTYIWNFNKALEAAVRSMQEDSVRFLLKDPQCDLKLWFDTLSRYVTILNLAAETGSGKITAMLLAHPSCPHVNVGDYEGRVPLHYACDSVDRSTGALEVLLKQSGRDINITDDESKTPLHFAYSNICAMRLLLQEPDCDVNAKTCGETVLQKVIQSYKDQDVDNGHLDLLLRHPNIGPSLMDLENERESILTALLKVKGNLSNFTVDNHFLDNIKLVISRPHTVTASPYTLAVAVLVTPFEVCELLVKQGASVNSAFPEGETALHCAVQINSYEKVKLLVDNKPSLEATWRQKTPLILAISIACSSAIIDLLAEHANRHTKRKLLTNIGFCCEGPRHQAMRLGLLHWIKLFPNSSTDIMQDRPRKSKIPFYSATRIRLADMCEDVETPVKQGTYLCELNQSDYERQYRHKTTLKGQSDSYLSTEITKLSKSSPDNHSVLQLVACCYSCNCYPEKMKITKQVIEFLHALSEKLFRNKSKRHFSFIPVLTGSFAEGTKTFSPNELDFICEMSSNTLTKEDHLELIVCTQGSPWEAHCTDGYLLPLLVAQAFYYALEEELRKMSSHSMLYENICVHSHSLVLQDKISRLQLLWKRKQFNDILIHVDLAPGFSCQNHNLEHPSRIYRGPCHFIAKADRYLRSLEGIHSFHISYACSEVKAIQTLPQTCRQALAVAKAMRLSAICKPGDIETLDISGNIKSDDVITSYMLKTCLLHVSQHSGGTSGNEFDWADAIYAELEMRVKARWDVENVVKLSPHMQDYVHKLRVCTHEDDSDMFSCCYRRRLILSLCRKIRQWLRENKLELEEIAHGKKLVYSRNKQSRHLLSIRLIKPIVNSILTAI